MWRWFVFFSFCLSCLPFVFCISFVVGSFPIRLLSLTSSHFLVLGGSIVACRSMQRHIVALESDIDVFKSILLPLHEPDQEHTSQPAAPQRGSVFAPPPKKMARRNFDLLCEYVCYYLLIFRFYFSSFWSFELVLISSLKLLFVQSST